MQTLNLTNVEKSDIKYTISCFPDGEVQITLSEFSRKDTIEVHCRITNAEELFILMQVADILNRHEVIWDLEIYYLMGMRMDRVMDFNRPFSLKIVSNIIKGFNARGVELLEPHSTAFFDLVGSNYDTINPSDDLYLKLHPDNFDVFNKYLVVYPDAGAAKRYNCSRRHAVIAEKVRNVTTGKIESIHITNPEMFDENHSSILVVDDLCDGGGTFVGIAQEIRKYCPDRELNIFVTHMVNHKGIENLSKNFDHVYFTNSYYDWESGYKVNGMKFPENITQINVI